MAEAESRLSTLKEQLADTDLYAAERKAELDELLRDEGKARQEMQDLENTWLELQQELEQLEAGL